MSNYVEMIINETIISELLYYWIDSGTIQTSFGSEHFFTGTEQVELCSPGLTYTLATTFNDKNANLIICHSFDLRKLVNPSKTG